MLDGRMSLGDFGSYVAFALMFAAPLLDQMPRALHDQWLGMSLLRRDLLCGEGEMLGKNLE